MPDLKISQLPVASTPLAGTELVPIVQGGVTDQTTVDAIMTSTVPSGTANGVLYLNGSKVATSGSALTFDGSQVYIKPSSGFQSLKLAGFGGSIDTFFYVDTAYWGWGDAAALGGNAFVGNKTGNFLYWQIAGTEQMRLNSTGLGIGTSSPGVKLDVVGAIRSTLGVQNANGTSFYWGTGTTYILGSSSTNTINLGTSGVTQATLDSSGNLGLGVTPSAWQSSKRAFQIGSGGSIFATGSTTLEIGTNFYIASSGQGIYLSNGLATDYAQSNGTHIWYTSASGIAGNTINFLEQMRLDSSGNLGLGVTPSAWDTSIFRTLQVGVGAGSAALFGRTDSANNVGLSVNYYYGTGNFRYVANGFASYYNQQNGVHSWHVAPNNTSGAGAIAAFTQAMTLTAAGGLAVGLTIDPGVGIISALNGFRLQSSSYSRVADVDSGGGFSTGYNFAVNGSTIPKYDSLGTTNGIYYRNGGALSFYCGPSAAAGTNAPERMVITTTGNQVLFQSAESAQNTSVTLTVANLQTRIITSNAAVTLTLPTGTDLESYTANIPTNTAFECTFIATTANDITIAANGNTTVGSLTVAGNTSGTFRFRKTATNTFTVYRVA